MFYQRFCLIFCFTSMLAGCAGLYEKQPPAPVYGGQQGRAVQTVPPRQSPQAMTKPVMPAPQSVVKTNPLQDFEQQLTPIEMAPQEIDSAQDPNRAEDSEQDGFFAEPEPVQTDSLPSDVQDTEKPAPVPEQTAAPKQEIAPEPEIMPLTPFQPIEPPASLSPAIGALVVAANQSTQLGNVDGAAASIDRALKIEPRNPALYYKLALLRLKQSKPQEAEDLAKKSALLAGKDRQLKRHSWLLIAHARELRRDYKGARQARAKADSF